MNYYIRVVPVSPSGPHKLSTQVWKIDHSSAVRVGISNAENSPGCFFRAQPGESIWDALRRDTPWFEPGGQNPFHQATLQPGQYYPRMARPMDQHPTEAPGWSPGAQKEANVVAIACGQLIALTRQLERICQTAHPTKTTFGTFGHDIRNLLILACTEAESHWRGVLVANGVNKKIFTTGDYVALREAMRLDECKR